MTAVVISLLPSALSCWDLRAQASGSGSTCADCQTVTQWGGKGAPTARSLGLSLQETVPPDPQDGWDASATGGRAPGSDGPAGGGVGPGHPRVPNYWDTRLPWIL